MIALKDDDYIKNNRASLFVLVMIILNYVENGFHCCYMILNVTFCIVNTYNLFVLCFLTLLTHCHLQDSSGIFWDNDSLAALLALELKADLLVLLSDVEGLYSGPPGERDSRIIHTYVKEKHQGEITFGDKSRVGRGGMTAKVKAAVYAASAGTPVVITRYFHS